MKLISYPVDIATSKQSSPTNRPMHAPISKHGITRPTAMALPAVQMAPVHGPHSKELVAGIKRTNR